MRYQASKTEDAHLGLALMAAVACGLAACWCFFTTAFRFLFFSGLFKIQFIYPPPTKWQAIAEFYACLGLAILFGIFVTHLVFRAVNRWLNSSG
ncbi:MAG: hypothetical protein WCD43_00710 [Candidatus Acidiferrales bacterium]